jgi:hypothetical protein
MMRRQKRFGLRLNQSEREGLKKLAEFEGLTEAATMRRLLRQAIKDLLASAQAERELREEAANVEAA